MPAVHEDEARALLATARVAHLGTHGPGGRIDLVPCTFAVLADGRLGTAVDHKPKATTRLQRLANVAADPDVALAVDHWDDEDWSALWWVRVHATASVAEPGTDDHGLAVDALVGRYRQYRDRPPAGPALVLEPTRWVGWRAT